MPESTAGDFSAFRYVLVLLGETIVAEEYYRKEALRNYREALQQAEIKPEYTLKTLHNSLKELVRSCYSWSNHVFINENQGDYIELLKKIHSDIDRHLPVLQHASDRLKNYYRENNDRALRVGVDYFDDVYRHLSEFHKELDAYLKHGVMVVGPPEEVSRRKSLVGNYVSEQREKALMGMLGIISAVNVPQAIRANTGAATEDQHEIMANFAHAIEQSIDSIEKFSRQEIDHTQVLACFQAQQPALQQGMGTAKTIPALATSGDFPYLEALVDAANTYVALSVDPPLPPRRS